jgi:hypothetical protein
MTILVHKKPLGPRFDRQIKIGTLGRFKEIVRHGRVITGRVPVDQGLALGHIQIDNLRIFKK